VQAVSKKLQVTGAAAAGIGPIGPIGVAKMAAPKVRAASVIVCLPVLTILAHFISDTCRISAAAKKS
jgi:hypothetical protein